MVSGLTGFAGSLAGAGGGDATVGAGGGGAEKSPFAMRMSSSLRFSSRIASCSVLNVSATMISDSEAIAAALVVFSTTWMA